MAEEHRTGTRCPQFVFRWRRSGEENRLFGIFGASRDEEDEHLVVTVSTGRLCTVVAAFLSGAYFLLVSALFGWLSLNGFNQVRYADLACPWRWPSARAGYGLTCILTGLDDVKNSRWHLATPHLRLGLRLFPDHPQGRRTLSELYIALGRADLGFAELEKGFDYSYPGDDYIKGMFQMAAVNGNAGFILRMSGRVEPLLRKAGKEELLAGILQARVQALMDLDRSDELLQFIHALNQDPDAPFHSIDSEAQALFNLGRREEACRLLEEHTTGSTPPPHLLRQLASFYRIQGNIFGMRDAMKRLVSATGQTSETICFMISQWHALRRPAEVRDGKVHFFSLFSRDAHALARAAALGESFADEDFIRRCFDAATSAGLPDTPVRVALATHLLKTGHPEDCLQILDGIHDGAPDLSEGDRTWIELLRTLAHVTSEKKLVTPDIIREFLGRRRLPLPVYSQMEALCRHVGGAEPALAVIECARIVYPSCEGLAAAAKQVSREVGERAKAAAGAAVRGADEAPLYDFVKMRERIERLRCNGDWAELAALLGSVYRLQPGWLTAVEKEMGSLRIEALLRSGQFDFARAFALVYHARSADRTGLLRELGERLRSENLEAASRVLMDVCSQQVARAADMGEEEAPAVAADPAERARVLGELLLAVEAGLWNEADDLFERNAHLRPPWLDPDHAVWYRLRLRVAIGKRDTPHVLALIPVYVAGDEERAKDMIALAQEAFDGGDREGARAMAAELVRRYPSLAPAVRGLLER